MFRHQGAIFRDDYRQQTFVNPTRISGQSPSILLLKFEVWKRWNCELQTSTSTCSQCCNNSNTTQRSASCVSTFEAVDTPWTAHTTSTVPLCEPKGYHTTHPFGSYFGLNDPVAHKLPDDGTLMPKHVGVGTQCAVYFMICFIVF